MKTNPFTEKAKANKKAKLRAFGSKTPAVKTVNGTAARKPNPFTERALNTPRAQLIAVQKQIDDLNELIDAASVDEIKKFRALDKLDLKGKKGTDRHREAKTAWDAAWHKLERFYATMHGLGAKKSNLIRELEGQNKNAGRT